jgi:hypothetical protein
MRAGILSHADLPHIIPNFRLARSLLGLGCDVRILGSDAVKIGKGHSEAWSSSVEKFKFGEYLVLHRSTDETFLRWLNRQIDSLQLDVLILDAVWQSLAYGLPGKKVIHHAGLPDFRNEDMPTWQFVHPNHGKQRWKNARNHLDALERSGRGVRSLFYHVARVSGLALDNKAFDFGCGEFAKIPATRSMSLPRELEFPKEAGRMAYLGTNLPTEDDADWTPPSDDLIRNDRPLILCIFGTTGLTDPSEYRWLLSTAIKLASAFADHFIAAVIPGISQSDSRRLAGSVKNLGLYPWIPLWETLSARQAPMVLVSSPGVGAFREAVTAGTPIVAIPRRLDQFGAAARIEYFGLGRCLVSQGLPQEASVVENVANCLSDDLIRTRGFEFKQKISPQNGLESLQRFIES